MAGTITIVLVLMKYGTAQFKLNRTRMQHGLDMARFFILHACKHACVYKIENIKPIIQSSCVHTRRVHDNLQAHAKFGLHACKL